MPTTSDQTSNTSAPIRFIVDEPGIDTELGIKGRGYSPDNGQTFFVQDTTDGRVYRLLDAKRLYPLLKPMFDQVYNSGPVETSLHWADILDKPDLATQDDLKAIKLTPGPAGKDGKSAYQIAVGHGFVGSEAEWLQSLHGKDGAATSGGDASLSIEAITELIKDHIHATVDTTNGQLTVSTDDVSNGSIADTVAAKVVSSMSWKLSTDGELIAEVGGE